MRNKRDRPRKKTGLRQKKNIQEEEQANIKAWQESNEKEETIRYEVKAEIKRSKQKPEITSCETNNGTGFLLHRQR